MKDVVVQKYGGSSVKDTDCIQKVADRIIQTHESGNNVVAVVSAMGNTTDELLELSRSITTTPSARELDMLLTVGERITMALLSMAIHSRGYSAVSFTGSQSGIITNASHSGARVVEVRPYRLQDELAQGKIVIVAGFQGVSYRREITTLGRGGSDTTAIALAAALDAKYCEICSDVDGVFTADPRVVKDAHRIDEMTHDEMIEMADGGARVLNAEAIDYARRHGIAIYARSTFGGPSETGTLIRKDRDLDRPEVTAITGREDVLRFSCPAETLEEALTRVHTLDNVLGEEDPRPLESRVEKSPTPHCVCYFHMENAVDPDGFPARLETLFPQSEIHSEWGSVTVVGPDVGHNTTLLEKCKDAMGDLFSGVQEQRIGRARLQWLVPKKDVSTLVQRLHQSLIS
jgi:aspartate kinase